MPKILLAGQDDHLLETRAAVLKKTGADVVYCIGSHAFNVIKSEMPDLVVLCHSLPEAEAEVIADKAHVCCPRTRVLLVVSQATEEKHYKYAKFDATSLPEPTKLITLAAKLLEVMPYHSVRGITHDRQGSKAF
jgi:DNA-binding response OmpR family regulator